ncbi:hypothetical protein Ndes2526B_g00677 [Nannochloris sp. 'desiccata']
MVDHHIRILLPSPLFPHPKPVSLYKRLADSEYMHFIALVHSLFAKTKAEGLVFEISHLNGNRPLRFVPKGEKHNRKEFFEAFHQDWKSACDTTTATVSRVASPALVTEEFHCEVSRNLEKCVLKKATVKTHPDGRLLVIPYSQARREALDAAVPVWFYYSFPLLVSAIASDNDKDRLVTSLIGSACAALAAACRLQSAWAGGNGHEDLPRGGRLGKPLLYFNKVDAAASSVDEYSAEVKRILDSRKNKKNSPASATGGGGGSFSWFKNRSAAQKKQPEHLGMLLAGMK